MLKAKINEAWAGSVCNMDVWEFNRVNAEDLFGEVEIASLGGLATRMVGNEIYTRDERVEISHRRGIIDLAKSAPAIVTSTSALIEAVVEQKSEATSLLEQLAERNVGDRWHGHDEPWFLPLTGIEVIEVDEMSRSDFLKQSAGRFGNSGYLAFVPDEY